MIMDGPKMRTREEVPLIAFGIRGFSFLVLGSQLGSAQFTRDTPFFLLRFLSGVGCECAFGTRKSRFGEGYSIALLYS